VDVRITGDVVNDGTADFDIKKLRQWMLPDGLNNRLMLISQALKA